MVEMRNLLTEGRGKRVYATADPKEAVVYYKDEAMAYHGLKRGRILGKGEVNNAICAHLYTLLEQQGVATHFLRTLDSRQSLIRRCEMIPVIVKVRNRVAGSLAQRLSMPMGARLEPTVVELLLKDDDLEEPLINVTHVLAMHLATEAELRQMTDTALRVNEALMAYMAEIGVEVVDIKLEFGRFEGKILLADEITPDTARFWDARTHEPMDIDRFKRDLGNVEQAYQDLLHRMMGDYTKQA